MYSTPQQSQIEGQRLIHTRPRAPNNAPEIQLPNPENYKPIPPVILLPVMSSDDFDLADFEDFMMVDLHFTKLTRNNHLNAIRRFLSSSGGRITPEAIREYLKPLSSNIFKYQPSSRPSASTSENSISVLTLSRRSKYWTSPSPPRISSRLLPFPHFTRTSRMESSKRSFCCWRRRGSGSPRSVGCAFRISISPAE